MPPPGRRQSRHARRRGRCCFSTAEERAAAESCEEAALIDETVPHAAEALDDLECRRLLTTHGLGRLVFTSDALPVVQVVRFGVRDGHVLIPTRADGRLSRAVRGAVVAFQVDSLDAETGAGWTVTAVGPAHVLTDPADIAAAALLGLRTWIPTSRCSYIAVQMGMLRGCRLSALPDRDPPSPAVARLSQ